MQSLRTFWIFWIFWNDLDLSWQVLDFWDFCWNVLDLFGLIFWELWMFFGFWNWFGFFLELFGMFEDDFCWNYLDLFGMLPNHEKVSEEYPFPWVAMISGKKLQIRRFNYCKPDHGGSSTEVRDCQKVQFRQHGFTVGGPHGRRSIDL